MLRGGFWVAFGPTLARRPRQTLVNQPGWEEGPDVWTKSSQAGWEIRLGRGGCQPSCHQMPCVLFVGLPTLMDTHDGLT